MIVPLGQLWEYSLHVEFLYLFLCLQAISFFALSFPFNLSTDHSFTWERCQIRSTWKIGNFKKIQQISKKKRPEHVWAKIKREVAKMGDVQASGQYHLLPHVHPWCPILISGNPRITDSSHSLSQYGQHSQQYDKPRHYLHHISPNQSLNITLFQTIIWSPSVTLSSCSSLSTPVLFTHLGVCPCCFLCPKCFLPGSSTGSITHFL